MCRADSNRVILTAAIAATVLAQPSSGMVLVPSASGKERNSLEFFEESIRAAVVLRYPRQSPIETNESHPIVDHVGAWSGSGGSYYNNVWNVIKDVRRHKKRPSGSIEASGPQAFFESAVFYEWLIFVAALAVFFPLFYILQDWPATTLGHVLALFVWLGIGFVYNMAVAVRLGRSAGVMWFTGYLLELIFSIENVFVFHIVAKTFRSPKRVTQKAIFIVVCVQIIFEMIFFMGLAVRVRSMQVLPYILGMWLLYVGYHAGKDDGLEEFDLERDSSIVRASKYLLGRRFTFTYGDRNSSSIFVVKDGQLCVSLVFPLICSMLAVDFFLEVDVTLTKIEELPNQYLAFSSSAVAAFAVPELFYVARDLFQRYLYLKHGISFVLCFFGVQMLMHQVFAIPDLLGCAIIIIVMVVCMIFSPVCSNAKKLDDEDELPMSNNSLVLKSNPLEQLAHYLEPAPEPPCREKGGGRGQSEASPGTKGEKEVASSKSLAQDGGEGLWVTVPI